MRADKPRRAAPCGLSPLDVSAPRRPPARRCACAAGGLERGFSYGQGRRAPTAVSGKANDRSNRRYCARQRRRASSRACGWLGDAPSSRSPLRGPALPEGFGLPTGQRPPAEIGAGVCEPLRRDQPVAVDRPAAPLGPQRPKVALAIQPQQLDRRPRHPVRAAIPRPDGRQRAPEQIGASLAAKQTRPAQLAETLRRQVPDPPARGRVCPRAQPQTAPRRGLRPRCIDANAYCVKLITKMARGPSCIDWMWPWMLACACLSDRYAHGQQLNI